MIYSQEAQIWDFPGGPVVKNLLANEGDTGSIPGMEGSHLSWNNWGHAPQPLTLACVEPMHLHKRSQHNEKSWCHNREKHPLTTNREHPHAATKTQCHQNQIKINVKKFLKKKYKFKTYSKGSKYSGIQFYSQRKTTQEGLLKLLKRISKLLTHLELINIT